MTENKRYTIKPQDDYFGITDNYSFDKVCVINGIRTKLEAEWLCDEMNELNDENEELRKENIRLEDDLQYYKVKSASCEQGLIQYEHEFNAYKRKLEEILRKWYDNANKLRTPIRKLDYGEDIGYWNSITQFIEELSDKLGVDLE